MSRAFLFKFMAPKASRPKYKSKVMRIVKTHKFRFVGPVKWMDTHFVAYIDATAPCRDIGHRRSKLMEALNAAKIGAQLSNARQRVF